MSNGCTMPRKDWWNNHTEALLWVLLLVATVVFCVSFTGCATVTEPELWEMPIGDMRLNNPTAWLDDGDLPNKVLTIINPMPYTIVASVWCDTPSEPHGQTWWIERVGPKSRLSGFSQMMNKDHRVRKCELAHWFRADEKKSDQIKKASADKPVCPPCLIARPPTLEDHKDWCSDLDPKTQTSEAIDCAIRRLNMYLSESKLWSQDAWKRCGTK